MTPEQGVLLLDAVVVLVIFPLVLGPDIVAEVRYAIGRRRWLKACEREGLRRLGRSA